MKETNRTAKLKTETTPKTLDQLVEEFGDLTLKILINRVPAHEVAGYLADLALEGASHSELVAMKYFRMWDAAQQESLVRKGSTDLVIGYMIEEVSPFLRKIKELLQKRESSGGIKLRSYVTRHVLKLALELKSLDTFRHYVQRLLINDLIDDLVMFEKAVREAYAHLDSERAFTLIRTFSGSSAMLEASQNRPEVVELRKSMVEFLITRMTQHIDSVSGPYFAGLLYDLRGVSASTWQTARQEIAWIGRRQAEGEAFLGLLPASLKDRIAFNYVVESKDRCQFYGTVLYPRFMPFIQNGDIDKVPDPDLIAERAAILKELELLIQLWLKSLNPGHSVRFLLIDTPEAGTGTQKWYDNKFQT